MRKYRTHAIALALSALLALFVSGCGSDTTTPTGGTDASALTDSGVGGDGSIADDSAGTDAAATADSTTSGDGTSSGDSSTIDAGPPAKYATCSAVGDCVAAACADSKKDCEKPCFAEASGPALQAAVPLLGCYQSKCVAGACKDSSKPGCNSDCMTEQCIEGFLKCIDTPATGDALCGSVFSCFDTCDLDKGKGFACYTACIDALKPEDGKLLADVGTCMANHPGKKIKDACAKQIYGCMIGSQSGDQGCHTVFKCSADCQKAGGNEDDCMAPCVAKLTKKDQTTFFALAPCFSGGKMNATPACKAALKTCVDPSGKEVCADTFDCVTKCPDGGSSDDPTCMFGCLHDATPASYDTFLEISSCDTSTSTTVPAPGGVTPTNPPGDVTPTDTGPTEACMKSIVTCAAPTGTGDCSKLFGCFQTCQKKLPSNDNNPMTCIFACATTGSSEAFSDLIVFSACNDTCKTECAGKASSCAPLCMKKSCPAALKACIPAT